MKKLLQAKTFIIPAMRAGLVQYENERVLVSNETLAEMAKSSFGIPLLSDHIEQAEIEKDIDAAIEKYGCGRVAEMTYDTATDLWMAHCVVDTQEGVDLFAKKYGVSTSYQVEQKGTGGTLNGVEYNAEILAGKYLHLAIVENPRYEMAKDPVFMNSADLTQKNDSSSLETVTENKGVLNMKFWKTKREEVKENASDLEIEVDGQKVSFDALVSAYKEVKNNKGKKNEDDKEKKEGEGEDKKPEDEPKDNAKEAEEKLNAEVDALLNSLETEDKDNETEDKDNETEDKDEKANEGEDEEKKEKEEKKNARFDALKNAKDKAVLDNEIAGFKTLAERADLGRQRYGKK
jgi:hypothetical protein